MADCYSCIFLNKHHCCRFSNYKASSDNDSFFACAIDSVMIKNFHTGLWCTWRETDFLSCVNTGHRKICHAVYVFFCCKRILDHCLIQMFRKWTEQKNAMDMVIFIYFIDSCKKLVLSYISWKKNFFTCNAQCFATFCCSSFIRNITWILANTDDAQSRINTLSL